MRKSWYLLSLCALGAYPALAYQPASNIVDNDHGGTDWIISASTVIAGRQTNLGLFQINPGVTVTVFPSTVGCVTTGCLSGQHATGGQYGSVAIYASTIVINGLFTATGSGYLGGPGQPAFSGTGGIDGSGPGYGLGYVGTINAGGGGAGYGGAGGVGGITNVLGGGGNGGAAYGTTVLVSTPPDISSILLGSGGGGGAVGTGTNAPGASGGSGGGAILLKGSSVTINQIDCNGSNGNPSTGAGAGGGGSGGTVLIDANNLTVGAGLNAYGGTGGGGLWTGASGGGGGGGRIKLFYGNSSIIVLSTSAGTAGSGGNGIAGSNGTIYYNQKPATPNLQSPLNSSTTNQPLFIWSASVDNDNSPGDGPVTYELQVSSSQDFATAYIDTNLSQSYFNSTMSLTTYAISYWRVRAYDQVTYGAWSAIWSFEKDLGNLTDRNFGGNDWIISASTVIAGRQYNIGNFTINPGVTVTVYPSTVTSGSWNNGAIGQYGRAEIDAANVSINGTLSADGSGFQGGSSGNPANGFGPGGGQMIAGSFCYNAGGGGYGNTGGVGIIAYGGPAYGDAYTTGTVMGSGGGGGGPFVPQSGGNGGGAILIQANSFTLNGTISARGITPAKATYFTYGSGGLGGGSGGNISIVTSSFSYTSGQLTTDRGGGGDGSTGSSCSTDNPGADGSGGRIQVVILGNGNLPSAAVSSLGPGNNVGTVYYLGEPTLSSPIWAGGDVGITTLTARWNIAISSVSQKYRVQFSTSPDFVSATTQDTFNLYASSAGLFPAATYYFRVTSIHPSLSGIQSLWAVASPTSTLPAVPQLNSPIWNVADIGTATVTARWNSNGNPQTVSYKVDFATSSDFGGTITSSLTYSLNFTSSALIPNTTIAFRVQAIGNNYNSQYIFSSATSTLALAPMIFQPSSLDVSIASVTARWASNGNSPQTRYRVLFATSSDMIGIYSASDTFSLSASSLSLTPNTTIAFQVEAFNNNNIPSPFSNAVATFTLAIPPALNNPNWGNGALGYIYSTAVMPQWNANGNPQGTTYSVQFATSSDFTSPGVTISNPVNGICGFFNGYTTQNCAYFVPGYNQPVAYRVQAVNSSNMPSSWAMSVTSATLVGAPTLTGFNVFQASLTVVLGANGSGDPPGTQIAITTGSFQASDSAVGVQAAGVSTLTVPLTSLANTTYTVSARAVNLYGTPTTQDWVSFGRSCCLSGITVVSSATKAALPQGPTITSPFYVNSLTVSYAWDAGNGYFMDGNPYILSGTTYQVQLSSVSTFDSGITVSTTLVSASGGIQSVLLGGLISNTLYYPRSRAISKNALPTAWQAPGLGRWTQPSQPILNSPNFSGSDVGLSSITANWNANGNPPGTPYMVQFATSTDFTSPNVIVTQFATTNISISTAGLGPNSVVAFRVLASSSVLPPWQYQTAYSNSVATATLTLPAGLMSPNWAVSDIGLSSITARWISNGNPQGTLYRVQFATSSDFVNVTEATTTVLSISSSVTQNWPIVFRVRSENYSGLPSTYSASVGTATLVSPPGIAGFAVYTTSVAVTLSPNGNPSGTAITITTGSFGMAESSTVLQGTGNTNLVISGLLPNTAYAVQARAVNLNLLSSTVTQVTGSTTTLSFIHTVNGFQVYATSAAITIGSNGNPVGTQIMIATGSGGNFSVGSSTIGIIGGTNTTLVISGLTPNTSYAFQSGSLEPTGSTNTIVVTGSTWTLTNPPILTGFQVFNTSVSITLGANGNPAGTGISVSTYVAGGNIGNFTVSGASQGVLGNGNISLSLTGLSPNTVLGLQAGSWNSAPNSSTNALVVCASTATLPAVPGLSSIVQMSSSAIILSWGSNGNSLLPPTSYQMQVSIDPNFSVYTASTTFLTLASTVSPNFSANTTYYFRVMAFGEGGTNSSFNAVISTLTGINSPAPTGILVTSTSISVSLASNGNGPGTTFLVSTGNFSLSNSSSGPSGLSTTLLTINGMMPNIFYILQTEALSYSGLPSSVTVVSSTWTLPVIPGPSSVLGTGAGSIAIAWGANGNPLTPLTSYQVLASTDPGFGVYNTSITYLTQAALTGLNPNATYFLAVKAYGAGGTDSPYNAVITTATVPNSPGVIGFVLTATSVTVYLSGNGNPSGTAFLISTGNFAVSNSSQGTFLGGISNLSILGLTPNTTYMLQAEALGVLGTPSSATLITGSTATFTMLHTVAGFAVYTTSVAVTIGANGNPVGTQIVISTGTDGNFTVGLSSVGRIGGPVTTLVLTGLSTNTFYSFQSGSLNPDGSTNAVTVTPSTYTFSVPPAALGYAFYASSASISLSPNSNPYGTILAISTSPSFAADTSSKVAVGQTCMFDPVLLQVVCTPTNSSIAFPQLVPNTAYNIWARSVNGTRSQSSIVFVASSGTLAMPPANLSFTSAGSTFTASWQSNGNPLNPPTSYEIDVSTSSDFANFTSSVTFALSLTTANLVPSANYYFRVRAFNQFGTPSAWITGQAETGGVSVGNGGLTLTATSASATILRNGNGIGSAIVFSTGTNGNTSVALSSQGIIAGDMTNLTITGLSTNTAYGFQGALVGQSSVTVFAFSSYTLSVPPMLLSSSLGSNSLSLNISANTNPTGTTFQVSTDNFNTISQGTGLTYSISSLAPNTAYTVLGRSINFGGMPSGSAVLLSTTTLSQVPAGLSASFVSFNALTFTWNTNGNPPGTAYKLDFFLGTSQEISSQTLTGTQATYTGLAPGTNYTLQVRAVNPDGSLTSAVSLTQVTKSFPVANAQVSVTTGSYTLTWSSQQDALALNIRDESGNLVAQLSSSAVSYSQGGFIQNQAITRSLEYYNQYITTTLASLTFHTAFSPPASIGEVMTILERTATSVTIQVTPPQSAAGQTGVRIRFIPAELAGSPYYLAYLYSTKPPYSSKVYHVPEFAAQQSHTWGAMFAADPPGTIVATFQNGNWKETVTGLLPGKNYVIKISYLNSDGVESPVSSSSINFFSGFSVSEAGIKAEKDVFFVSQGINFIVSSNNSGNGTIKVYGVNQNLVRQIPFTYAPGSTNVFWDGNDDRGQPIYSDVYWAVIEDQEFGKQIVNVAGIR